MKPMNISCKCALALLFFVFFRLISVGQAKKEQIVILSNRIDSLNLVIKQQRNFSLESIYLLNFKLDSIAKKLIATENGFEGLKSELDQKIKEKEELIFENRKIEIEMINLKEANSRLLYKLDSMSKSDLDIEMVFVEGGAFQMGNKGGIIKVGNSLFDIIDEKPIHTVVISSFSIGKFEVTQAQWREVMGSNPSKFSGCDNCPVETVSWNDVHQYIQKLNDQTGKNYRLPTEAEWEYAAKGGKDSRGYTYSGSNNVETVAWYYANSGSNTHSVGTKQANELGIYDMSGNVLEWCSDWYGVYGGSFQTNPAGASLGEYRVLRGGTWCYDAQVCRAECRSWSEPEYRGVFNGFRLVLPSNP